MRFPLPLGGHDRAAHADASPTIVCAWCESVLIPGSPRVTHSMCAACLSLLERGGLSDEQRPHATVIHSAGTPAEGTVF